MQADSPVSTDSKDLHSPHAESREQACAFVAGDQTALPGLSQSQRELLDAGVDFACDEEYDDDEPTTVITHVR